MVRLATMETSAAPMAPPTAAGRRTFTGEIVEKGHDRTIRGHGCRGAQESRQGFGLRIDILSIEHLIGAFEQLTDASAMQFQLQAAESQCADHDFAVTLFRLVDRL